MSVQILNCASMSPWWPRWQVGATCLLVDTDRGPVLVDTGLGLHDHKPPSRLLRFFWLPFGIHAAADECAVCQVTSLGIRPQDVQHIVLTHLHFDHAGGLPDFPWARIHLHRKEYEAMRRPRTWIERFAYDPEDFAHQPDWVLYERATEKWFDFDAIPLPFSPRMYLIPLFGHTSGHCGLAVEAGAGWIFQAADALPINARYNITPGWLNRLVLGPHVPRLKAFAASHPEVQILAGHGFSSFYNEPIKLG